MARKKAEYRSAVRSRRMIREAFVGLLTEKDLEKITVTDIIERADISRGTFYAHYRDARDLVEQLENEIIAKMLEFLGEFRYESFFQDPLPLLMNISSYLAGDLDYFRILINSNGSEKFLEKLKGIFVSHMETDADVPEQVKRSSAFFVRVHFFAGGLVNLYQVWFCNAVEIPLEEISKELARIMVAHSAPLQT